MKKIISAAALAAMVAGTAFADVSWSANARVYDDVVTYDAPTRANVDATHPGKINDKNAKGTDDNGKLTWNKDVKHGDDVTIKASGENCGAQITFDVTGAANGTNGAAVTVGTYKLWATILPNLTLNAGTYDTRLGKNINNDGNWNKNLNSIVKPGVYDAVEFDNFTNTTNNKKVAKDSTNITVIGDGNRKFNNFMAQYKVNDNLTAYAVVWTRTAGFTQATWEYDNNSARFSPFGVGAKYSVNKDTAIAVTVKNEANVEGSVRGLTYEQVSLNAANIGTAKAGLKRGYVYGTPTAVSGGYQIWSAAVDVSTKVAGWDAEAAYTFAAGINDKVDTIYGHSLNYWYKTADLANNDRASLNEYIHAFDLRAKGNIGDKLSITALGNVTYKPATAHTVHITPEYGEVRLTTAGEHPTINADGTLNLDNYAAQSIDSTSIYENEFAYNAGKGLSGKLAHYESLSVDYAFNSQITFEVQVHHQNTNVYATGTDDNSVKVGNAYKSRYDILTEAGVAVLPASVIGRTDPTSVAYRSSVETFINGTERKVNPLANSTFYVRPAVKYAISKQAQLDAGVQFQLGGLSSLKRKAGTDVTALTVTVPVTFRVKL